VYGDEFEKLYKYYVSKKMYKKEIDAQELWYKILDLQIETGMPYIVYKDNVNYKCNQKNLGTIKSSNLCSEISLYSDDKEYAVCNLCSICLPKFVKYDANNKPYFDHNELKELSKFIIRPMNKVIDNNVYPVKETELSNMRHRPIGVGVQGLSDVFVKMRMPFESNEAKLLNKEIFETIYYGCVEGSIEEAKKYGRYSTFEHSPFSQGKLQFHLTNEYDNIPLNDMLSGRWNWDKLLKDISQYGMRNSMLTALMPTASTSQIMGNTECFEQFDTCIFKRRVLSGEFIVCNKYLVSDLTKLGLWNSKTKDLIIANNGSIQSLTFIPKEIRDLYKTVWEISMKSVIDLSADRQAFIDQTQSLNLFVKNPNHNLLTKIHFYGWSKKLKTGMYYLRSQPSSLSGKFSVDVELEKKVREQLVCSIDNKDECLACSS
jgi:ribonucleoside-diphosphate reductase alpha chain